MIPTVAEERAMAAQRRVAAAVSAAGAERRPGAAAATQRWRSHGPFAALVFFFFAAIGVFAAHLLLEALDVPTAIAGFAAIAVAELLIARKWFGTGVESALWLGGLFSSIFSLPGEGKPEAILLFAAASALAGWRVRNPFFGALAAVFVVAYLGVKDWRGAAQATALIIAAIACAALAREWRRPSTEWLWIAMLVAMIPTAYYAGGGLSFQAPAFFIAAAVLLACGIRMRHHAPLVASAVALVIGGGEWFERSDAPIELLLALSGTLLMTIAYVVSRALRGRTEGWVTTPMQLTGADDALEQVSVIAVAPHVQPQEPAGRREGGGSFGGAGATGEF